MSGGEPERVGAFRRLRELTQISNRFDDTLRNAPTRNHDNGHRRGQLSTDRSRVDGERQDEIQRLMRQGIPADEISAYLDRIDRYRNT